MRKVGGGNSFLQLVDNSFFLPKKKADLNSPVADAGHTGVRHGGTAPNNLPPPSVPYSRQVIRVLHIISKDLLYQKKEG